MIIKFKVTRDIFEVNLSEQSISLRLMGTGKNVLGNSGIYDWGTREKMKFLREQGKMPYPLCTGIPQGGGYSLIWVI